MYYVIHKNKLWRQFHAGEKDYITLFLDHNDPDALAAIKRLDMTVLKKIFSEVNLPSDEYLKLILGRRDKALDLFAKKI